MYIAFFLLMVGTAFFSCKKQSVTPEINTVRYLKKVFFNELAYEFIYEDTLVVEILEYRDSDEAPDFVMKIEYDDNNRAVGGENMVVSPDFFGYAQFSFLYDEIGRLAGYHRTSKLLPSSVSLTSQQKVWLGYFDSEAQIRNIVDTIWQYSTDQIVVQNQEVNISGNIEESERKVFKNNELVSVFCSSFLEYDNGEFPYTDLAIGILFGDYSKNNWLFFLGDYQCDLLETELLTQEITYDDLGYPLLREQFFNGELIGTVRFEYVQE